MGEEKFPFPKWHRDLEGTKLMIRIGCENDPEKILEYAAKTHIEMMYFKDLLLFIKGRLQKYIEGDTKGIGLGIDSSREIFEGLMLVPAEEVSFPENNKDKKDVKIRNMNNKKKFRKF